MKLLTLLIGVSMTLILAACGESQTPIPTPTAAPTATSQMNETRSEEIRVLEASIDLQEQAEALRSEAIRAEALRSEAIRAEALRSEAIRVLEAVTDLQEQAVALFEEYIEDFPDLLSSAKERRYGELLTELVRIKTLTSRMSRPEGKLARAVHDSAIVNLSKQLEFWKLMDPGQNFGSGPDATTQARIHSIGDEVVVRTRQVAEASEALAIEFNVDLNSAVNE